MITLPNKPKIIEQKGNQAIFEIEACYPGYGMTLGNTFRRVLLSSLPGAAITGVKIKGVQHEFSTIPYVTEDVVQIILNLKQVRFKLHTDQLVKTSLKIKGEKKVKAKDIKTSSELEVVNDDAHIATLTNKKASLEMEIEIESGLGYLPVEKRKKGKIEIGKIAMDAIFSPIRKVTYSIEDMRVGERTDYDRLRINIETDGTITPKDAFLKTTQILVDHYNIFMFLKEGKKKVKPGVDKKKKAVSKIKSNQAKKAAKDKKIKEDIAKIKIEDLKISSRTIGVLDSAGFKTVAGLVRKSKKDLENIEGLGDKGIVEIKRALGKFGLTLKS
ncbi:MAG: DNA-directed RNA polymerase subunit alpha [Parcubacteria group bacterium]|jgi:DNA-directed RNA polymerase subunit alpha|nr:DNA-directed RNA polymerase subunit alpha [Parcubacteria group bacterium]|tara:strand:+ start:1211 stop:2197 length:987 start_codon:yes stop_codon:yes gene_type:complete